MKRIYIGFLSVSLCLLLCPAPLASASGTYNGGDGSAYDPFRILTAQQLIDLGRHPEDYDKNFILTADIDLGINADGGKSFRQAVIAPDTNPATTEYEGTPFSGTFDGSGYKIQNLTIEYPDRGHLALFGKVDFAGTIMNLILENAMITSIPNPYDYIGTVAGENLGWIENCHAAAFLLGNLYTGGLVGYNHGELIDCHTAGTVQGGTYAGGLIGFNDYGFVQKCNSSCTIYGWDVLGGLIGTCDYNSLVSYCYADGVVMGSGYTDTYAGGLIGSLFSGDVYRCYANGYVNGYYAGGLVGDASGAIDNCYAVGQVEGAYVGGITYKSFSVNNSFWDVQTSGVEEPGSGTGLPTSQMMQQQTFLNAGWDFNTVWAIEENVTYPYFQWQVDRPVYFCQNGQPFPPGDLNSDCTVDLQDFALFTQHWMEDHRE